MYQYAVVVGGKMMILRSLRGSAEDHRLNNAAFQLLNRALRALAMEDLSVSRQLELVKRVQLVLAVRYGQVSHLQSLGKHQVLVE
jgi:hypothetical protein